MKQTKFGFICIIYQLRKFSIQQLNYKSPIKRIVLNVRRIIPKEIYETFHLFIYF